MTRSRIAKIMFLRDTIFNNVNNLLFHFSDDISKYEFDQVFNDYDQPENGNFNGKFYYTRKMIVPKYTRYRYIHTF